MFGIEKNIVAPQMLDDLLSGDEMSVLCCQQNQQFHRDFFEFDRAARSEKFIAVTIQRELVELNQPD